MYSQAANEFSSACNDKILVDLQRLKSIKMYDDILDYIQHTFGDIDNEKHLDYPNDIKVDLYKNDEMVLVYASQKGEKIFGTCWEPIRTEEQ